MKLARQFAVGVSIPRQQNDPGRFPIKAVYDPPTKPRHVVDHAFGKNALTFWKVLERCGDYCRVELTPITGRS
ncbi:hypothetical protein QA786_14815, partial [Listeria monocytogenes]|uniref:hypothetical protein n=1 Tax=Listeria monocytogenes TaxID=1639 RepID=UPI0024983378